MPPCIATSALESGTILGPLTALQRLILSVVVTQLQATLLAGIKSFDIVFNWSGIVPLPQML